MAFGQQSGPPAPARMVQELLALLQDAGHSDFRDARGPMGFNQRQAGGKFSRDEATAFIEQLQAEQEQRDAEGEAGAEPAVKQSVKQSVEQPAARPAAQPKARVTAAEQALRGVPTDQLAAELQRRGWIVVEP